MLVPSADSNVCHGRCSGGTSPRLGRVAMMAVGTTLLCAACMRSAVAEYGPVIIVDASGEPVDAGGQPDPLPGGIVDGGVESDDH